MPTSSLPDLTDLATRLAETGGQAAAAHFRRAALTTDNKDAGAGFDPVTEGDRAAERAIREILAAERPDDGILGEEEAPTQGRSGLTWVIDPIDGTRAYISGLPTWGVLVGLDDGAAIRIGVVEQPYMGERFLGVNAPVSEGGGAWLIRPGTRRAIRTRACADLAQATLFTTDPTMFGDQAPGFERVRNAVRLTRYGIDCYAYALVALGLVDLVIEAGLKPFDIAGPMGLVEAAGGVVTDWQGGDCRGGGAVVAAGDRRIHDAALALLNA